MTAITGPWQKAQALGLSNIRATADGVVGKIGEYTVGIREPCEQKPPTLGDLLRETLESREKLMTYHDPNDNDCRWFVVPDDNRHADSATVVDRDGGEIAQFQRFRDAEAAVLAYNDSLVEPAISFAEALEQCHTEGQ